VEGLEICTKQCNQFTKHYGKGRAYLTVLMAMMKPEKMGWSIYKHKQERKSGLADFLVDVHKPRSQVLKDAVSSNTGLRITSVKKEYVGEICSSRIELVNR